jgi:hypothetical protein
MLRETPLGLESSSAHSTDDTSFLPRGGAGAFGNVAFGWVFCLVSLTTFLTGIQNLHALVVVFCMMQRGVQVEEYKISFPVSQTCLTGSLSEGNWQY